MSRTPIIKILFMDYIMNPCYSFYKDEPHENIQKPLYLN